MQVVLDSRQNTHEQALIAINAQFKVAQDRDAKELVILKEQVCCQ